MRTARVEFRELSYDLHPPGLNRQAVSSIPFEMSVDDGPRTSGMASVECNIMEMRPKATMVVLGLPEWATALPVAECAEAYRSIIVRQELQPRIPHGGAYTPPNVETIELRQVFEFQETDVGWDLISRSPA